MRIFHISDLHIGKQLYGYSLRESRLIILQSIIAVRGNTGPMC